MIVPMTKYDFILLSGDKDRFLEQLRETGIVDIRRSDKPVDEVSSGILSDIEAAKAEIKSIENCSDRTVEELKTRIADLGRKLSEASPWGEFDRERLEKFSVRFYTVSKKQFDPAWKQVYPIEVINEDKYTVWFVTAGTGDTVPATQVPIPEKTPSGYRAEIDTLTSEMKAHVSALEARKPELPALRKKIESMYSDLSTYLAGVTEETAADGSLVIFEGFAPTEDGQKLKEALDGMDVYYIAQDATVEDNPPIKIHNNAYVRQFEPLTSMYGMPVYNEFDPTVFLSIFFLLFFAMCMGDVGYGILLVIIGFVMRKKAGSGGLADKWSLIVTLGAATIVVGFLFGGFFGVSLTEQTWIPEALRNCMITGDVEIGGATYAKQMILSLLVGVVHICIALVVKAVWAVRQSGFKDSLSTLGWTLLIVGGVIGLSFGMLGVISETAMKWLLIGIAGASALGIYIFNKWGRNPLVNIGAGLWDTYNMASGLMSDVLSYIRLYALGLSGSMLGSTFNLIAGMVKGDDPTWQWIPFVLIVVLGHTLNLALNCLSAFVHPLRLNFVEFFKNSGYMGEGAGYNPIRK